MQAQDRTSTHSINDTHKFKYQIIFIFETLYISSPNSYPSFRLAQTSNFHYLEPFFLL